MIENRGWRIAFSSRLIRTDEKSWIPFERSASLSCFQSSILYPRSSIVDHLTGCIGEQTLSELTAVFNLLGLKILADHLSRPVDHLAFYPIMSSRSAAFLSGKQDAAPRRERIQ
jgi:hypothetical protein